MPRTTLLDTAHQLISAVLRPGDKAIDATVGNGHDTLFLLATVGCTGLVFGFDIQQAAIEATRAKALAHADAANLILLNASHADMNDKIPTQHHGNIRAVMFNLGYLPGGDKTIITRAESTLTALNAASQLISHDGVITVMAYPGHQGGLVETGHVEKWCETLAKGPLTSRVIYSLANKASAPRLFVIGRQHPTHDG